MGCEFAQGGEWSEARGLDWWHFDDPLHAGCADVVRDLNRIYKDHPALWTYDFTPDGFEWIEANDGNHNVLAYLRKDNAGDTVVVIVNFAGVPHEGYRVGLPSDGEWVEILNTDELRYGGSGVTNPGPITAEPVGWMGRRHSAAVRVPPLGAVWLTLAKS